MYIGSNCLSTATTKSEMSPVFKRASSDAERATTAMARMSEKRALMRLVDLYVRTAEPEQEADSLLTLVKAHRPGPARRALQIRLANVYSEKLEDPKKCEEVLEAARRESPTDLDVLRTFARLDTLAWDMNAQTVDLTLSGGSESADRERAGIGKRGRRSRATGLS